MLVVNDEVTNAFTTVVKERRSVRAFLPDPIPQHLLEKVFDLAQNTPSNCNTQPWQVHVVSGEKLEMLRKILPEALLAGEYSMDFPYAGTYEGVYKERQYDAAYQLYSAMGIDRADRDRRNDAFLRNFVFFDAPYVAFLFLKEDFGVREAADIGAYAQTLMLSLVAHGFASCPQTALSFHADKVRELLKVPSENKLLFGISFGYEDRAQPVNQCRVGRAPLNDTVQFHSSVTE